MKIFENGIKFFEKGTWGGISSSSNRYSKASNKYLKSCEPKQESKHVIYLDVNDLYDYASGFKWIDPKGFDLNRYTCNSSKECVLEVGLQYLKELRELHNDYPLAQDKTEIKREMLCGYQLRLLVYTIFLLIGNVKKLLPNFFEKKSRCFIMKTCSSGD